MKLRPHYSLEATDKNLRRIRKSRHITAELVREYMGFESVQSIYKWERGECLPSADNFMALALLYEMNPLDMMVEDGKPSSAFIIANYYYDTNAFPFLARCQ